MEDYKKNFLDLTEIDRIQQEIERNLYNVPQSDNPAGYKYINTEVSTNTDTPVNSDGYIIGSLAPGSKPVQRVSASKNVFYHETIKNESTRKKKKRFIRSAVITVIICTLGTGTLGIGLGMGYPLAKNYFYPSISSENSGNYISASNPSEAPANSGALSEANLKPTDETVIVNTVSDIIKLVAPSVVSIKAVSKSSSEFFSLPYNEGGSGSGIIFSQNSENIYIATNHHVITGASAVSIQIGDSNDIPASFVGSNPETDLAVISISKEDIAKAGINTVSIAVFGDSDNMQVGDPVIAIGNALGEGNIVTSGIVSARNKEIAVNNYKLTVIQTDAAINPGNSGGPLINTYGEVIGINTARLSRTDVEGMGYSITSNVARPALDDIMKQVPKPFLGIQGVDLTKELADVYKLPNLGVLVQEVVPGSSAQKAGIQRTDVITGFNGESIFTMKQLSEAIQKCTVGDEVTVKVYRNGANVMEFKVKLAEYKTDNF